jgi:tetratricopeptide (TPR) repeat protein
MATDLATASQRPAAPDPTRRLWQVPVFLLGMVVFVSTVKGWIPVGPLPPAELYRQDVADLRAACETLSPDREKLKERLVKVAGNLDLFPDQSQTAHFMLGSGYARLAELTPVIDEAKGYWTLAKQHFEQVRKESLRDPQDVVRLSYRSAKARAAVGYPPGTDPKLLGVQIVLLSESPDGEDPGEAGRLQAEIALQMQDLNSAAAALTRYLTGTGKATPEISLNRGRVLLGEINFRLKRLEAARNWLSSVTADAPPEVVAGARSWLARVNMADGNFKGATADWEAVRAVPGLPAALRAAAAYHLAQCKLKTREPEAAQKLLDEALKGPDAPESTAAAFTLADLYLNDPDPAKHVLSADLLVRGMKGISGPPDLLARNVNPNEVEGTFVTGFSKLTADEKFEAALKAVQAYVPIAKDAQANARRAEILQAWAKFLQDSKQEFKPRAEEAAREYAAFAAAQPAPSVKADALRKAAAMYRTAGDAESAVTALKDAATLPDLPNDAAGKVWKDLADALIAAKRLDEVWPILNKILETSTAVSTVTRYELARQFAEIAREKQEYSEFSRLARMLYEQIAKKADVAKEEQAYQELAMFELASDYFRAGNYPDAEFWLRKQLHTYQTGARALRGRLYLGICALQQVASLPPADAVKANALLTEAFQLFRGIVAEVDSRLKKDARVSDEEVWLRLQSEERILQCYYHMKSPNELLFEALNLRERCRGTVDELIVMSFMYHAFKLKQAQNPRGNDEQQALAMRDQMRDVFDKLPETAFKAAPGEYSRAYWQAVLYPQEAGDPKNPPKK